MFILVVLTIVAGVGTKTTVGEYATREQCSVALKQVVPANYPGYFLTSCLPKPD